MTMYTQQRLLSFLPVLLIGILCFLLIGFLWESRSIESACLDRIQHETQLQTRMSAMLAERFLLTESEEELPRFAAESLVPVCDESTRITLMREDGTVLADSWEQPQNMSSHSNRPEIINFKKEQNDIIAHNSYKSGRYPCVTLTRYSTTTRQKMLYCVTGFSALDQNYILRTAVSVGSIESIVRNLRREVSILSFLAMAIAVGLGYLLFYWMTQPLTRLRAAASKIANGTFETPLPDVRRGSLREISLSIGKMSDQLQKQLRLLSRENVLRNTILDSLQEGVILTNDQGTILHLNATAARLIDTNREHAFDQPITALWRNVLLKSLLLEMNSGAETAPTVFECNLDYNERQIHLLAKQVREQDQSRLCLLVLYDKTKENRLENYRRDFIANLSHEIKTPLTVISGAAEAVTLDESLSPQNRELLQTLMTHSTRLQRLLEDVLSLAKIESVEMKNEFSRERIPLADTVEIAISLCQTLADERHMALAFHDSTNAKVVSCNPELMEQVVLNLIENAIKYSREGDTINLELSEESEKIRLIVADHGPGIPPKDQQRVFERFYRVERSRDRATGGTGLGLAIVKHIVQLHGGSVRIDPNTSGATFIIELPNT